MSHRFLTARDVAKLLQLAVEAVCEMIARAGPPATKLGGSWRFDESELRTEPAPPRLVSTVAPFVLLVATSAANARVAEHEMCESCHGASQVASGEAPVEICGSCHHDRVDLGAHAFATLLGSQGGGNPTGSVCTTCHSPHPNDRPYGLRETRAAVPDPPGLTLDEISRLCVSCHAKMGEIRREAGHYRRHPVGLPVSATHRSGSPGIDLPLIDARGTEDPTDDTIGCTTCHRVHRNSEPYLLRWGPSRESEVCLSCHEHQIGDRGRRLAGAPAGRRH